MKILSWNVQGFENKYTRYHLSDLITTNDLDLVFLSETKNKEGKVLKFTQRLEFYDYFYIKPIGISGGLFLLWKDGINIDIVYANRNFIICRTELKARSPCGGFGCRILKVEFMSPRDMVELRFRLYVWLSKSLESRFLRDSVF